MVPPRRQHARIVHFVPVYHSSAMKTHLLMLAAASIAAFAGGACAQATHSTGSGQAYPAKPVRLVLGWPPGGAADGIARPLAARLTDALGRTVVVDNRAGATGTIGATVV